MTLQPLNTSPLSECDTWPSAETAARRQTVYDTPQPMPIPPAVVYRPRTFKRHSRLYWLAWDARWWLADALDAMRYRTGWLGEVALMLLCAAAFVTIVAVCMVGAMLAGVR